MKSYPAMSPFPVSENVARMQSSATLAAAQAAEALRASGVNVCDFGAGEPDFDTPENIKQAAAEAMRASRDFGVQNIPAIARRYAEQLSMKEDFLREYLEENVQYSMDDACLEGLRLFYNKAADLGVIKSTRPLEFL